MKTAVAGLTTSIPLESFPARGVFIPDHFPRPLSLMVEVSTRPSSGVPDAHKGQADGSQRVFGRYARLSSGTPSLAAKLEAEGPRTSRAPMAAGLAPQDCSSAKAPRTADPALMTSSTTAAALPQRVGRRAAGMRYPTGYRPSLCGRA